MVLSIWEGVLGPEDVTNIGGTGLFGFCMVELNRNGIWDSIVVLSLCTVYVETQTHNCNILNMTAVHCDYYLIDVSVPYYIILSE